MAIHKLRALEYLVAVVEQGSFAAAARKLDVATPSVHRLVKALESDLGVALLDRSTSPMRPTPDAAAYIDRARSLVAELQGLDASLRDQGSAPQGTLSVAAHSVVLQFVLPPLLARFHERFPQVRLELLDPGTQRDLSQLQADLLLQFGWPPPQAASLRTLASTRWVVVASPAYWARHGVPAHPSELARHTCMLYRTPYGEVIRRWAFERGDETAEVNVDGWLISDHRSVLDAPLHEGRAVARVNDLTLLPGIADGSLQPVLLDWTGLNAPPLNLLIRRAVARQPRVRAFVDFVAAEVERQTLQRLPAGLPPVRPSKRPDWFKRRVG